MSSPTPGTVFVSTWGYDQTNVDFYVVVKATEQSVWLQPIGQRTVAETGWASETVEPSLTPTGKVFRRKIKPGWNGGVYVSIDSVAIAQPHTGRPVLQTRYA